MGVIDRVMKSLRFGTTPAAIETALAAQGMNGSAQLGPGRPLTPSAGYSQHPRATDYPIGVNQAVRSRQIWGRTSYETLREMTNTYDIARICINHKIDEIRSMDLLFQPADGVTSDVRDALDAARAVLAFPDREHEFGEWLAMWLENQLRYDAGVLYRRRNMAGDIIGLEVLDGTTIFPNIDEHGRRPSAPAPAYYQVIKGLPFVSYTAEDLTFLRFRPQPDSPFGLAPLESILLTANTDIRRQWHMLQMFTDGSVPNGFIELPPDISSPDQVAEWQDYWDAVVQGDQAKLHQLVAVPAGTKLTQTRPKGFDKDFANELAIRTASAYMVVPQDINLLGDVNRSTGDTQVDVQFRVNTLPWVRFVESPLNRYLQYDLGLPVKVSLDTGRDKEDRLTEAQAWKTYVETGAASMDEMRQELLGLPIDNARPVPRGIITARTGFVPLTSILGISGPVDGETGAPSDDVPLALTPFAGAGGVLPDKGPGGTVFTRAPQDPDEPMFPELEHVVPGTDVVNGMPTVGGKITKDAAAVGRTTAGVTSATGIAGNPLEDDELKTELKKFRQFVKTRAKAGKWRDFDFTHIPPDEAERLNKEGRESVPFLVPGHEITVAGLAVKAASTGRVLMLQRALDDTDPAAGKWEFPGGHLEAGESPEAAAVREWSEEVGLGCPDGDVTAAWVSGIYEGFVLVVPDEFDLSERDEVSNPDGDMFEAVAWWDPADLPNNAGVRPELLDSLSDVLPALASSFAKASWRDSADKVPQHKFDLKLVDHYAPKIQSAIREFIDSLNVDAASNLVVKGVPDGLALKVIQALGAGNSSSLESVIRQVMVDSFLTGSHGAITQLGAHAVTLPGSVGAVVVNTDWDSWVPGDVDAGSLVADGGLKALLDSADITVKGITDSVMEQVGNRIGAGLDSGWSSEKIGRDISDLVGSDSRAMMIAHTEVARAQTIGSMDTYAASGVGTWDLVLADDPCEECQAIADTNPHPVADTEDNPPIHPYCLPGSARIVMPSDVKEGLSNPVSPSILGRNRSLASASAVAKSVGDGQWLDLRAVTERDYVGDFITITLELGHEMTVTPNHPVATVNGWIAAGELREGEDVLCRVRSDSIIGIRPDVENIESSMQQIANALPVVFGPMPSSAEHFHGDGANGDVYVVRSACQLLDGGDAGVSKRFIEDQLVIADVTKPGLGGSGTSFEGIDRSPGTTHHSMSSISESLSLVAAHFSHAGVHRVATIPRFDSSPDQSSSYESAADAEGFCESLLAFSEVVTTSKVVKVNRVFGHAPVYNIDTTHGWFFADGFVVHNCRCAASPNADSITAANVQTIDATDEEPTDG